MTGLPADIVAMLGPPADFEQHVRDLADKLKVNVWVSWHRPMPVSLGNTLGNGDLVLIFPPDNLDAYATALHELGHSAQRHARHEDKMVREERAWLWARWHTLPGVTLNEDAIAQSLEWHRQNPEFLAD